MKAVINVLRHASAIHVSVAACEHDAALVVEVQDAMYQHPGQDRLPLAGEAVALAYYSGLIAPADGQSGPAAHPVPGCVRRRAAGADVDAALADLTQ
jgi:hypothetical protein